MWVGTGLLAPIVVIVPLQLLTGGPSSGGGEPGPIADWVYAMVYAGFTWQALPTVLVWTGSGAMFAWSAYLLALFVGRPELVGDIDVSGVDLVAELARVAAALLAAAVLTLTQRHVVETFHRER